MIVLKTNKDGILDIEFSKLGGQFPLKEKIKLGGVGSTKIIYDKGVAEFDLLRNNLVCEPLYANFELLRNGVVVRCYLNNRLKAVGVRYVDISTIHLLGYRIKIKTKGWGRIVYKTVHRGELLLALNSSGTIELSVPTVSYKSVKKSFERDAFSNFYTYSISLDPIEKDYSGLFITYTSRKVVWE